MAGAGESTVAERPGSREAALWSRRADAPDEAIDAPPRDRVAAELAQLEDRRGPRWLRRRKAEDAASSEQAAAPGEERAASTPRQRQTIEVNRGLRMILLCAVAIALISWSAVLARQYIRLLEVRALIAADPNAVRVMCAAHPPSAGEAGWLSICQAVIGIGAANEETSQAADTE